jgi:hypothetical protein
MREQYERDARTLGIPDAAGGEPTREECAGRLELLTMSTDYCSDTKAKLNQAAAYLREQEALVERADLAEAIIGYKSQVLRYYARAGRNPGLAHIIGDAELEREIREAGPWSASDAELDGLRVQVAEQAIRCEALTKERDAAVEECATLRHDIVTLASIRGCATCGEIGLTDCCCEWQCGDPDDCHGPAWEHWTQAPVAEIIRRKREADEQRGSIGCDGR